MIECTISDGIGLIKMAHGKVNAMSLEFVVALNEQLESLAADDRVKQVIIAGNDRVFSAGVDLKRLISEDLSYLDQFLPELTSMFMNVFEFRKPVIAAITGHAVAGGCVLACAADYRVISNRAKIGVPELRVGVPFPVSGMEIMRWATTASSFRKVINTGATFYGDEAVTVGFADETADAANVLEVAMKATEPFSVVPPDVFRITKRQMHQPVMEKIARGKELFEKEIYRLWRDDQTRGAVSAYVAERLK